MNTRNDKRGVTLVEALVSLGILALLSTLAIPYYQKYQTNLKLSNAAKNLTSDLRYAQQLTIAQQVVHQIQFDKTGEKYSILKISTPTSTVKTINLDSEIKFNQINGLTNDTVIFNSYGGVFQAGQIILNNQNSLKTINIKPSGYIELSQ